MFTECRESYPDFEFLGNEELSKRWSLEGLLGKYSKGCLAKLAGVVWSGTGWLGGSSHWLRFQTNHSFQDLAKFMLNPPVTI